MKAIVAVVGPTAAGKSALAIALAGRFGGEILSCDSTAVYRRIDIGTDKVAPEERRGIPHHLLDLVGPDAVYSAADFARDAARTARDVVSRGRVPILAGGTGFYYRALVRGLFDGPSRDTRIRSRLEKVASVKGTTYLHQWLGRVDPASAQRIQPADRKRLIRALEVYLLTRRPLSEHFAATRSLIDDFAVLTLGVQMSRADLLPRVSRRVQAQFDRGIVAEVRALLDEGLPPTAHALGGLVYRQVIEMLGGVRDEPSTRALIIQENLRYARRQMTWFRAEPGVHWIEGPGESTHAIEQASAEVDAWLGNRSAVRS